MKQVGLTRTQRDMMLVIEDLIAKDGFSPSYRELAHEMSFANVGAVGRVVDQLVERGYLDRRPACARSLAVLRRVPMPEDCEFVVLAKPGGQGSTS